MAIAQHHIQGLIDLAGAGGATTDPDIIAPHLVEWRDKYQGNTQLMVMPDSTETTAKIVRYCAEHKIAIVPQGGNTGLVGGSLPGLGERDEILISMKRMTAITRVNAEDFSLTAEAGATIHAVQEAAQNADRLFPLSLASEGSCTAGGTISTNAGGVHVGRYGSMRALVLGLEGVLPNGEIFSDLSALRKNNTGYDIKQLMIGAEGTLGIITKATLKLYPREVQRLTCWLAVPSPEAALSILSDARKNTGDRVSVIELVPHNGLDLVLNHIPGAHNPLSSASPWYVLLEVASSAFDPALEETMATLLNSWLEMGLVTDGTIASSETQAEKLWALRENMSEAQKCEGASIKHDIAVPVASVPAFLTKANMAIATDYPGARVIAFGHLGDGNIHYNIMQPKGADKNDFLSNWESMNKQVHDIVIKFGGSISAEHGIGSMKSAEMAERKNPGLMSAMKLIKKALDPNNIMNPGALFR